MQNTAPNLELRDIHLPSDPSIWPLAPGWWILIVLLLITGYVLVKLYFKIRKRNLLNKLMQNELININASFKTHKSKHQLAGDVSQLLKRFVRHILKDPQASSLTGKHWIEYLNEQVNKDVFTDFSDVLTTAQYSPDSDFDVPSLMATIKNYFPKAIKFKDKNLRRIDNA